MKNILLLLLCFIPMLLLAQPKNIESEKFNVSLKADSEILCLNFSPDFDVQSVALINNDSDVVLKVGQSRGGTNVLNVPIEDLENGTYFLRIQVDGKIHIQRIIINK